jgi:hypothetical protein
VFNDVSAALGMMDKSYRVDLRARVWQALDEGKSRMTAHRTCPISRSSLDHGLQSRVRTNRLQGMTFKSALGYAF